MLMAVSLVRCYLVVIVKREIHADDSVYYRSIVTETIAFNITLAAFILIIIQKAKVCIVLLSI